LYASWPKNWASDDAAGGAGAAGTGGAAADAHPAARRIKAAPVNAWQLMRSPFARSQTP
jgi:hypothetical protein